MKRLLLLVIAITSIPLVTAAQTTQEDVSEIMETLSSDDMRGRKVFSPSIDKAADFIAGKFSQFGLKTLESEQDYLQKFHIKSITLEESRITVDGETMDTDSFFAVVSDQDVRWADTTQALLESIPPDADFRSAFSKLNGLEENLIVFVDPSHSAMFQRYRPYFSRPTRSLPGETQHDKVFILAEKAETFNISLDKKVEQRSLANVVGKIEGKKRDEIVLFSAHYDHIGVLQPVAGDSIANGANDNASGTTAVIELARYFSQQSQPERTLLFVAFTAEEAGGYGSKYFSRQLSPGSIVAMFNIEMIGKPFTDQPNAAWITGFEKSTFGELLQKSTDEMNYTFLPDPYPNQNLFYRSDNATLARLGVPAHSISTTPIDVDPDYHKVSDEIETVNLPHITATINAIARAAEGIVSGKYTPTRVDKDSVN